MRAVAIISGAAYGDGGGAIPGALLTFPRNDAGNLIMIGTGQQHWSTVDVADLAGVFRRVLENGAVGAPGTVEIDGSVSAAMACTFT
jgi:NAD dependent epimerase/dehydratase family enzyme